MRGRREQGCSPDVYRDSHRVSAFLQSKGYRVIPVAGLAVVMDRCPMIDHPRFFGR